MNIHCPICLHALKNVPADFPHRPFCSNRCKMADLDRWLTEEYRISAPVQTDHSSSSSSTLPSDDAGK